MCPLEQKEIYIAFVFLNVITLLTSRRRPLRSSLLVVIDFGGVKGCTRTSQLSSLTRTRINAKAESEDDLRPRASPQKGTDVIRHTVVMI